MAKEAPARTIATVTTVEGDEVTFNSGVPVNATNARDVVAEVVAAIYPGTDDDAEDPATADIPEHIDAAYLFRQGESKPTLIAAEVKWHRGDDWRMFIELESNDGALLPRGARSA